MHSRSADGLARQSERLGPATAVEGAPRLDRRRFLRSSALTVAGVATLSGVELARSPLALAQAPTPGLSPVTNLQLNNANAAPVAAQSALQLCHHFYQFDYAAGANDLPGVPPDLPHTYRLNEGTAYAANVPGGAAADRLQAVLQPAPFQNPATPPADPYPVFPSPAPTGVPINPQDLIPLVCYRLVQPLGQNAYRAYDWCSFYCFLENFVVLTAGDKSISYRVGSAGQTPPPPVPKNVVSDAPQLADFWGAIRSGEPHSIGGIYYYTYNSQQGAFSTATWTATLDVPQGTQCKVEAFIPGSSQPQNRTAQAKYIVSNSGVVGNNVVTISQQLAQSQWVTLGTFPFRAGSFSVRLTDETGEARGSRIVVADAIRWTTA